MKVYNAKNEYMVCISDNQHKLVKADRWYYDKNGMLVFEIGGTGNTMIVAVFVTENIKGFWMNDI